MNSTEKSHSTHFKIPTPGKERDNFLSNLKYIITVTAAYLKNYPIDDELRKTIIKTANAILTDCLEWERLFNIRKASFRKNRALEKDHILFQRTKLLALMMKSYCIGNTMGKNRDRSLSNTVDTLCASFNIQLTNDDFKAYNLSFKTGEEAPMDPRPHAISDQRKFKRLDYHTDIKLIFDRKRYMAELMDLSLGGAFVSGDIIPHMETGEKCSLIIPFALKQNELKISGAVKRLSEGGAGFEFVKRRVHGLQQY